MARLRRVIGGLRALLRRQRVEQELDEELREYLEASVEAKVRSGMTPEAARRAARAELGSVDAVKDYTRDVGWETTFEQCRRDVRYAVRTLRKSPVPMPPTPIPATSSLSLGARVPTPPSTCRGTIVNVAATAPAASAARRVISGAPHVTSLVDVE